MLLHQSISRDTTPEISICVCVGGRDIHIILLNPKFLKAKG